MVPASVQRRWPCISALDPCERGSFADFIIKESPFGGAGAIVICFDPLVHRDLDMLKEIIRSGIDCLSRAGRVFAVGAGPPCATWSAARHIPLPGGGGPRPLRAREDPWTVLEGRTEKETVACRLGTALALAAIFIIGECASHGAWFFS